MFETWFTNRCMKLVGNNGKRLEGAALEAAEAVLNEAKLAGYKVWADKDGLLFKKGRGLFAKAEPLFDPAGNRLHICGNLVKIKANYCTKCAGEAPGGWWRCGECGTPVPNDRTICPKCGHHMNPLMREDLSTGSWKQRDGVFAERFDLSDVNVLLPYGLNIQENQRGLFLEGGELAMVLKPGHYKCEDFRSEDVKQYGEHSVVFVDLSEFSLPLRVGGIYTKESMTCEVHLTLTLQFDEANGDKFLCNLMRNRLSFNVGDLCTASIGYDEIMDKLLQPTDHAVRNFCVERSIDELFKSSAVRSELEQAITAALAGQLESMGLRLIRLGEMEFESDAYDQLRGQEGEIELQRRKNEFMLAADDLANDTTKRKTMSDQEMEDFMADLAQKAAITKEQRDLELTRIRRKWQYEEEKEKLSQAYDLDLDKLAKSSGLSMEQLLKKNEYELAVLTATYDKKDEEQRREAKFRLQEINDTVKELDARHAAELRRLLAVKQNEYDQIIITERIHEVENRMKFADRELQSRIELEEVRVKKEKEFANIEIYVKWQEAKQAVTEKWIIIQQQREEAEANLTMRKQTFDVDLEIRKQAFAEEIRRQQQELDAKLEIERKDREAARAQAKANTFNGKDFFAILASIEDPALAKAMVEAHLGEIELRTKPDVILAAMAKRGNDEAMRKIDAMDAEQKARLEKTVEDNRDMYNAMMQMNERMFNQMTEKMTRPNGGSMSTTNVIKQE